MTTTEQWVIPDALQSLRVIYARARNAMASGRLRDIKHEYDCAVGVLSSIEKCDLSEGDDAKLREEFEKIARVFNTVLRGTYV